MLPLLACLIVAAPVPRESPGQWQLRTFGEVEDPDRDCDFEADPVARTLTVRVPAAKHGTPTSPKNAPRTGRPVTGDFAVEVGVAYTLPPFPPAPKGGMLPPGLGTVGGGLWVRGGDGKQVILTRHHSPAGKADGTWYWSNTLLANMPGRGHSHGGIPAGEAADPFYLRVTRTGNSFAFASSRDRKTWKELTNHALDLPAAVTVGVYAVQSTGAPVAATFHDFALTVPDR